LGNAEQLYFKVEILELPEVWWQHLTWIKIGYETDIFKYIIAFPSTSRASVTKYL
jgi:hypothetical protein